MISIPSIYNRITQTRLGHISVKAGVQTLTLTTKEPAAIGNVECDVIVTWRRTIDNSNSTKPRQDVSAPFS